MASEGEASIDESIFVASGRTAVVALGVRHCLQRRRRQAALAAAVVAGGYGGDPAKEEKE